MPWLDGRRHSTLGNRGHEEGWRLAAFIQGLELNRLFYEEVVRPLLAERFSSVAYSAALIGYGSDVLGYDTVISADHEWGPRLLLFLGTEDLAALGKAIDEMFRRELPSTFRGYSTHFTAPDRAGGGVRQMAPVESGEVHHHIHLLTVEDFLAWELGIASADALSTRDWLTFPEQKLLEVTAGVVYFDGLGRLVPLRHIFAYFPHDIWLYRLSAQWQRISQEEAFVGRTGDVGDELGSRIVAARLARDLMRLCFLLERRYAPYSKWLGTAFTRLACAGRIAPLLSGALAAATWEERQQHLAAAYEIVAHMQNDLGIAEPQDARSSFYYGPPLHPGAGRPYRVIHAERFATALRAAIRDADLRRIADEVGLVGGVDQLADSTDVVSSAAVSRRLGMLYGD